MSSDEAGAFLLGGKTVCGGGLRAARPAVRCYAGAGGLKGCFNAAIPPYEVGGCCCGSPNRGCARRFVLVPPTAFLLRACRPIRWWIRFHCGATIEYFRGCRPTGKPRRLKQPTGLFLRAVPPNRTCARRFVLVPPMAFLLHACRPIRWWIRFRCDGSHAG